MNTKNISILSISFGILMSGLIFTVVLADTTANIDDTNFKYPITELGNCQDKESCKAYCDNSLHLDACMDFAEKNNLMSKKDIDSAKKFINAGEKGPGGCTGKDSCQSYCDDINHIDECVAYAEKTGILSEQDLQEAKQIQSAIARGVKPPACKNKKECDVYCDDPNNMKVCVAFGEEAGFLKGQDLEDAKKMITAIDKGAIPPPCKGREACEAYCSQPDNMETCMTFAQAAGFMTPKEAEESQKMLSAIKKGVKPPDCKGKESCDIYCSQEEHFEECVNFGVAAGFMSEKDAEMARKTGGKGPGGCRGKEECEAFCNKQENQETCFNFGKENGLISPEQLKEMEEGNKNFSGSRPSAGPGGCKSPEECGAYCRQNPEECKNFGQQGEQNRMSPNSEKPSPNNFSGDGDNFGGPGGCKSPEECKTFCEINPEECKNFQSPIRSQEQMRPPQNQEMGPNQYFREGVNQYPGENTIQRERVFPDQNFRPDGTMTSPQGNMPSPYETQQMMPQGEIQPQDNMQPPFPYETQPQYGTEQVMPPSGTSLPSYQPEALPQIESGSYTPPPPPESTSSLLPIEYSNQSTLTLQDEFLLRMVANIFLSLWPQFNKSSRPAQSSKQNYEVFLQ